MYLWARDPNENVLCMYENMWVYGDWWKVKGKTYSHRIVALTILRCVSF